MNVLGTLGSVWKHLGIVTPFVYYFRDILALLISISIFVDRTYDHLTLPFQNTRHTFDFIIVGSGSAGSVLASRLSEHHSVLLLEAGGSPTIFHSLPLATYMLNNIKATDWAQRTTPQKYASFGTKNHVAHWPAGKALGGSTTMNGMIYTRGNVQGFDEIANKTQDPKWSMDNMLRYFKKIENYEGFYKDGGGSDIHGKDGHINVVGIKMVPPLVHSIMEAGQELGYRVRDPNDMGPYTEGFSLVEVMQKSGMRYSTYDSLLKPLQHRPNLVIRKFSHVTKVLMQGNVAVGVEYERHGKTYEAKASKEVILSAGALMSPKILMLSGIGPKQHLRDVGIEGVLDLPVGQQLQDKYGAMVAPFLVDENQSFLRTRDVGLLNFLEWVFFGTGLLTTTRTDATMALITNSSRSLDQTSAPDIHFYLCTYSVDNRNRLEMETFLNAGEELLEFYDRHLDMDAYSLIATLAKPYGFGSLKLRDKNPHSHTIIDPEYLKDERDVAALVEAMKFAIKLSEETGAMQKINARFTRELYPGCEGHARDSDAYYECFIRHNIATAYKLCGTVPIGKDLKDPHAVVDSNLRVFGTKGLRVVDGSVLQSKHVSVNDIVIRAMSEMMAEVILEQWRDNGRKEEASPANEKKDNSSSSRENLLRSRQMNNNFLVHNNETMGKESRGDVCEWKDHNVIKSFYVDLCTAES